MYQILGWILRMTLRVDTGAGRVAYIRRHMASGWRWLPTSAWHGLGITWNSVSSFGLSLCKDVEMLDMIQ